VSHAARPINVRKKRKKTGQTDRETDGRTDGQTDGRQTITLSAMDTASLITIFMKQM